MNKITFLSFAVIIPLALLIFAEVSFLSLLAVSILLAFPAFFLLNLPDLFFKLEIILGLIAATVFMFLVLRSTKIFEGLKRFFKSVFRKDSIQEINDDETEGWNDFSRNAIPPKHYFSFAPLVLASFFTAALYGGIIFVQPVISFCSIFDFNWIDFYRKQKMELVVGSIHLFQLSIIYLTS
jgi:hypothetical protein